MLLFHFQRIHGSSSLQKELVKFFALFGVYFFAQVIHFDELDLVGVGHRRHITNA
jgi:hypothetical protein